MKQANFKRKKTTKQSWSKYFLLKMRNTYDTYTDIHINTDQ